MGCWCFLLYGFIAFASTVIAQNGPNQTDILTGTSGRIASDNWPSAYLPNTQHRWIINAPPNNVIQLQFQKPFALESAWLSNNCYDQVNIIEAPNNNVNLLGSRCSASSQYIKATLCGTSLPPVYQSSSNVLVVELCSDNSIQLEGFAVNWNGIIAPLTTTQPPQPIFPTSCGVVNSKYPGDITFFPNGSISSGSSFSRIVGGKTAPAHSWPWAVNLWRYYPNLNLWNNFCGATLINSNWLVSAAHCFYSRPDLQNYKVKLGASNKGSGPTVNEPTQKVCGITQVIINPSYDPVATSSDIALLQLDCTVSFTPEIQPACVPLSNNDVYANEKVAVVGWGTTSSGGSQSADLQEVIVSVLSDVDCGSDYKGKTDYTMFCAAAQGKDSCQGDSGGPLLSHSLSGWFLSGIVSWGYGCAQANYPGVYTRVANFQSWIATTIQGATMKG